MYTLCHVSNDYTEFRNSKILLSHIRLLDVYSSYIQLSVTSIQPIIQIVPFT